MKYDGIKYGILSSASQMQHSLHEQQYMLMSPVRQRFEVSPKDHKQGYRCVLHNVLSISIYKNTIISPSKHYKLKTENNLWQVPKMNPKCINKLLLLEYPCSLI